MSDEKINVLLKELEIASDDHRLYVKNYHLQVNFIYIYASLIFTFFGIIKSSVIDIKMIARNMGIASSIFEVIIFIVICMLVLIAYYLVATAMNSLYMAFLEATKRGYIENLINKYLGEDIIVWDSKVVSRFYSVNFVGYKSWINPAYLIGFLMLAFLIAIHVILILICHSLMINYFPVVLGLSIIFVAFLIHQWMALQTTGKKAIKKVVLEETHINSDFMPLDKNVDGETDKNRIKYILPTGVIFIGVAGMILMSLIEKTFFPPEIIFPMTKIEFFPLIYNFSVLIGDTLVLIFFNYFAFKLFVTNKDLIKEKLKPFIIYSTLIFIGSVIGQIISHFYFWAQEPYKSFLHLEFGKLTAAGWWHLVYSIFQTLVIFMFLRVLFYASHLKKSVDIGIKALYIFLIFSCIGILDYISKKTSVLSGVSFWQSLASGEIITLIKISLSLMVIRYLYRKRKKLNSVN